MSPGNRSSIFSLTIAMPLLCLFITCVVPTHASYHYAEGATTTGNGELSQQKKRLEFILKGLGVGGLSLLGAVLLYRTYEAPKHEQEVKRPLEKPVVTTAAQDTSTRQPSQPSSQSTVKIIISPPTQPLQSITTLTPKSEPKSPPHPKDSQHHCKEQSLPHSEIIHSPVTPTLPKTPVKDGGKTPQVIHRRSSLPLSLIRDIRTPAVQLKPRRSSLPDKALAPKPITAVITETVTARRSFIAESPFTDIGSPLCSPDPQNTTQNVRYKTPPKEPRIKLLPENAKKIAEKAQALHTMLKDKPKHVPGGTLDPASLLRARDHLNKNKEDRTQGVSTKARDEEEGIFAKVQKRVDLKLIPPVSLLPTSPSDNWD